MFGPFQKEEEHPGMRDGGMREGRGRASRLPSLVSGDGCGEERVLRTDMNPACAPCGMRCVPYTRRQCVTSRPKDGEVSCECAFHVCVTVRDCVVCDCKAV